MPAWSVAMCTRGKAGEEVTAVSVRFGAGASSAGSGQGQIIRDKGTRTRLRSTAARPAGGRLAAALAATRVRTSASRAADVGAAAADRKVASICFLHDDGGAAADQHRGGAAVVAVAPPAVVGGADVRGAGGGDRAAGTSITGSTPATRTRRPRRSALTRAQRKAAATTARTATRAPSHGSATAISAAGNRLATAIITKTELRACTQSRRVSLARSGSSSRARARSRARSSSGDHCRSALNTNPMMTPSDKRRPASRCARTVRSTRDSRASARPACPTSPAARTLVMNRLRNSPGPHHDAAHHGGPGQRCTAWHSTSQPAATMSSAPPPA